MKKLAYILLLAIVGLAIGVACESGDGSTATAQTEPKPPKSYTNEYNDTWEITHNDFTLKRLYDSYDAEYQGNPNSSNIDRSHLDVYGFVQGGMKYIIIQNEYDDMPLGIINVTKDSLICASLAKTSSVGSADYLSDHQKWYNEN